MPRGFALGSDGRAVYINGGARGFLIAIDPKAAERVLQPTLVDVAVEK